MNKLYLIIFVIFVSLLLGCNLKDNKQKFSYEVNQEVKDTVVIVEKDSIDILIEQRAKQIFNYTIFAGLRFGDNGQRVKKVLQNKKHCTIKVPNGEKVGTVFIQDHEAIFYNDKLASLTLYAEEDQLYNALAMLFSTKYGKTKMNEWQFADCKIEIGVYFRRNYNPSRDAGYGGTSIMYHDSFKGERTKLLTKDPAFLKIMYNNIHLLQLIERQKIINDSLDNVKRLQEIKQEKELARKLATEPATNI